MRFNHRSIASVLAALMFTGAASLSPAVFADNHGSGESSVSAETQTSTDAASSEYGAAEGRMNGGDFKAGDSSSKGMSGQGSQSSDNRMSGERGAAGDNYGMSEGRMNGDDFKGGNGKGMSGQSSTQGAMSSDADQTQEGRMDKDDMNQQNDSNM
jgi:hypothetical protein